MEKQMKIINAFPIQARNYTDRSGQQKVFKFRPLILSDGIDFIYAEAQGDYAESIAEVNFSPSATYNIQMTIIMREWQAQDGTKRYNNEVVVRRIGMVSQPSML